jgi:hypothetical protein
VQVRGRRVAEALMSRGTDQEIAVGVVDVIGERLSRVPVDLGGLRLGDDLHGDAKEFPEGIEVGLGPRRQDPVGAVLLGVRGQPGRRVPAGIHRDLHEHHPVVQPRRLDVALQGNERSRDEGAFVLAQRQERSHHDVLAAVVTQ